MLSPIRVFFCAAALVSMAAGQAAPPKTAPATAGNNAASKNTYADEAVVVEQLDTAYRYNADGTGSKLDTDVARLQSDAAIRTFGVLSIPYAAGSQKLEVLYLRVRKANGTVVSTPATDAQDQPAPVTQAAPFYSDLHILQIPVRGLAVGDRLEYQVRTVFTQAEAKDQFWGAEAFGNGVVVLERGVELRVPAGKYVQVSSPRFPAKITEENGEKIYRWTGSQLKPTPKPKAGEAAEPEEVKDEDKRPPIVWTTFHSWAEVGEWYRGLALDRSVPTPALKAKADELVYKQSTPEAKLQALYAYVSSQVRYISVSLGVGRYQPHAAAEVLANQYGDCKDKHTLLAALLRAENLPVSTVLIGAGVDLDPSLPMPGWFNHALTLTSEPGGGEIWLDTTPEVAPFRFLSAPLRDKQALVIPAQGEAVLRRTPADPPFPVFSRFEAAGKLDAEGDMKAHVDLTMRGDDELNYRQGLRSITPAQWDRVAQFYATMSGFSGNASNTVADQPEKTDKPLHLGYDYDRKPFGDWDNFKVTPLEPGLTLPMSERKTAPVEPIKLGGKRTEMAVSRITLPPGFSADLPQEVHLRTEFATLDKTYRLEKVDQAEVLVTERTLSFKQDELPVAQWAAYRKFADSATDTEPWVQLTSTKGHAVAGHHPPAPGENNPIAAGLVQEAGQLMQSQEWDAAAKKLDEAKAANPQQINLWSNYGYLAMMNGRLNEASEDFRKELKEHPGEPYAARSLADVQLRQQDAPGAVKTLQEALAVDGKNEQFLLLLGEVQLRSDKPGAEKTLRAGVQALPDSLALKLALGDALLKGDKRDEGAKLLDTVATESQDASQLNTAAYALGNAGVHLPVAEAASRRSIQMLNEASARGESGISNRSALVRSMLLIASWDTYGWILYQEHNYAEAEPWLRAAWADGFGSEPGKHLGQLLEKEGRSADAAKVLRLAEYAEGASASSSAEKLKLAAANGAGRPESEARKALQDARTFTVPRQGNGTGWASFEFDDALNAAQVIRYVRGETALEPAAAQLSKVDIHTVIPPGSPAHLLRRGVLSCHAGPTCTLVMLPPGAALAD